MEDTYGRDATPLEAIGKCSCGLSWTYTKDQGGFLLYRHVKRTNQITP